MGYQLELESQVELEINSWIFPDMSANSKKRLEDALEAGRRISFADAESEEKG